MLAYDRCAVSPLDFSTRLAALRDSMDTHVLTAGQTETLTAALDEYLYLVDNNWYAYDWSTETFHYFTDYVLEQPVDRLMWGAGRVQGHVDLFDIINSLQEKSEVKTARQSRTFTGPPGRMSKSASRRRWI